MEEDYESYELILDDGYTNEEEEWFDRSDREEILYLIVRDLLEDEQDGA